MEEHLSCVSQNIFYVHSPFSSLNLYMARPVRCMLAPFSSFPNRIRGWFAVEKIKTVRDTTLPLLDPHYQVGLGYTTLWVDKSGWWGVRIPVSSPYIEVPMDTSGPYALVKARTDTSGIYTPTRHTGHTHTLHVTYTIDKHSLRARFPRAIYTTRTRFTSTLYARTIYAPTYA